MTRFARAKGSKASNERVPEQATPWREMKNEMEKTKKQTEFEKERLKMNAIRQKQYDEYLEKINTIEKSWADFPKPPPKPSVNQKITPKKKSRAIDVTEDDVTDEMIDEFCAVDLNVDETLEGLKSQIEACLQKKRRKETKNKGAKKSSELDAIAHKNYVSLQKLKITDDDSDEDETTNFVSLKNLSINDSSEEEESDEDTTNQKRNFVSLKNLSINDSSEEEEEESDEDTTNQKRNFVSIKSPRRNDDSNESDEDTNEIDEQASSDEAPEEQSAKIAPIEVVKSKKQKNKRKPLKIEPVTPKKPENETQENVVENSSKGKKKKKGKKKETSENGVEPTKGKKNKRKSENNVVNEASTHGKKQKVQNAPEISKKRQKQTQNPVDHHVPTKKNKPGKKQRLENTNPQVTDPKRKQPKVRDNKEHKPRKPNQINKIVINGVEEELVKFQGIPICKKEADRLSELRKQMISRGIPRSEVERKLKVERRRAEKQISRQRRLVCFQCRKSGHMLSECPEVSNSTVIESAASGFCFKCGSTEHTYLQCRMNKTEGFKFATCFICREQGHIARECPDNPKGLYPDGGACKLCGDVTHLKKDCPKRVEDTQENTMFLNTISDGNLESLEESTPKTARARKSGNKNKIVKF